MPIPFADNFNSDRGWVKANASVNSTFSVANGVGTLTRGGSYKTCTWTRPDMYANDLVIGADIGDQTLRPMIVMSQTDNANFLFAWLTNSGSDQVLKVNKLVADTNTLISELTLASVGANDPIRLEITKIGTRCFVTALKADGEMAGQIIVTSTDVSDQNGYKNGLAMVGEGSRDFDNLEFRALQGQYTNIVCLGDSNTKYSPHTDDQEYAWQMHKRKKFRGITCVNSGVSGNRVAQVTARLGTDLDPYFIAGARNVCTILIGINNLVDGDTAADAWADMVTLINAVVASGWETYVMTYFHGLNLPSANAWRDDLRDLVMANAPALGATVIDTYPIFGCTKGGNDIDPGIIEAGNFVHISPEAKEILARALLVELGFKVGRDSIT